MNAAQVRDTAELCALARFRILDARNCNEAAKDKLLLAMAEAIERLQKHTHAPVGGCPACDPEDAPCLFCGAPRSKHQLAPREKTMFDPRSRAICPVRGTQE